jgi:hypothetical protein
VHKIVKKEVNMDVAGRKKEISLTLQAIDECVMDIEIALKDGLQQKDQPVIREAVAGIKIAANEVGDIELDIDAAIRSLTVGRDQVFDERLTARDRAHKRLIQEMKSTRGLQTVSASDPKPAA